MFILEYSRDFIKNSI